MSNGDVYRRDQDLMFQGINEKVQIAFQVFVAENLKAFPRLEQVEQRFRSVGASRREARECVRLIAKGYVEAAARPLFFS